MKKIYHTLILSAILSFVFDSSFSQTITLGNLGTTSFCPSGTLAVPFTTDLPAGTAFKAYLSNSTGSFSSQTQIGNGTVSPINVNFPSSVASGTGYLIKIVSVSLVYTSNFSNPLSLTPNPQPLVTSLKRLNGEKMPNDVRICQGATLTGILNTNQVGATYEWKKDGIVISSDSLLRITASGGYTGIISKIGCPKSYFSVSTFFSSTVPNSVIENGSNRQCIGSTMLLESRYLSDSATYQWKKDGVNISGKTKDSLMITQTGVYTVDVQDKCPISSPLKGSDIVFSNLLNAPVISIPERSVTLPLLCGSQIGGQLYSDVSNNPISPTTLQWKKNGIDILYQNNSQLNITQAGIYSLKISQGLCSTISNGITFTKVDTIRLAHQLWSFSSLDICEGMVSFIGIRMPVSGMKIKVLKDGSELLNAYSDSYRLLLDKPGKYQIEGSALGCVVLPSDTFSLKVRNNARPHLFYNRTSLCGIDTAVLGATFLTLSPSSFQWYKNSQPILGATNRNIYVAETGFYQLKVSSGLCVGTSDSIEVKRITQLPKPKLYDSFDKPLLQSSFNYFCANSISYILGVDKYSYFREETIFDSLFWKKNGQIISKYDRYKSFPITESGTYTVIGKQGTCETESDPVEIKIGEPITANITGSTSIYPGQKAKLNLNFTGGNAWSYQTSDMATGQTTTLSPTFKNVSPSTTQTYSITSVASNCGIGTITSNATVTVLPCPIGQTISLQSGNWNTATTWSCGQIPTAAYDAIIKNGHTVNLPNGYQGITKKLDLRGGLTQGVGAGVKVN
jgi:trimeric autotransporter adhesin